MAVPGLEKLAILLSMLTRSASMQVRGSLAWGCSQITTLIGPNRMTLEQWAVY